MVSLVKCDLTGEIGNFDDSYQITIYNRKSKTRTQIDVSHLALKTAILDKLQSGILKWEQWDKKVNKYVKVE